MEQILNRLSSVNVMGINEFISLIESEFEDLRPGCVKPESCFREVLDWCSVNAIILMAMIMREYQVEISAGDIASSVRVKDLFDIIRQRALLQ